MNVSDTRSDPRPRRFCKWFQDGGLRVSTFSDISDGNHSYCDPALQFEVGKLSSNKFMTLILASLLLLRQFRLVERFFLILRGEARKLAKLEYTNVVCGDLILMPLASQLNCKNLIFDAREFYPRQFEDQLVWRLIKQPLMRYLAAKYTPRANYLTTVSRGLAREYVNLGGKNVTFLPGYAAYRSLKPKATAKPIRIIHHGHCNPSRHIEDMLAVAELLDERFEWDFYFLSMAGQYGEMIRSRINAMPKVRLKDPVPSSELIELGNQYDIGMTYFRPATFNLAFSLSNKIFEFIQSRCMLVCGYVPEAAFLFEDYDVGIHQLDGDIAAIAGRINALDDAEIDRFKANTDLCAKTINSDSLREQFFEMLHEPCHAG